MKIIAFLVAISASLTAHAKNVDVQMKNNGTDGIMTFEPGYVRLQPGDTVTFIPTDKSHSSSSAFVPGGAQAWTGKMDQKVTVKFDKEGIYIYKCDPHLPMAMAGVVQVGKPVNLDAAKAEAEKMSKNFAMNKDRLAKYLAQAK